MRRFLNAAAADASLDPKALGLGRISLADILARIAQAYGLGSGEHLCRLEPLVCNRNAVGAWDQCFGSGVVCDRQIR